MDELACNLKSVTIEHLRGYEKATLDLTRQNILLVGPNNSGKTSLLRLLHWALKQADDTLLVDGRRLSPEEEKFLMPARNSRGGARRITLGVRIQDGRRARKFRAQDGVAQLRLQFRAGRVFAAVGPPSRGEEARSSSRALELLAAIRSGVSAVYIGPSRDANSHEFTAALQESVRRRLAGSLIPTDPGGTSRTYRKVREGLREIEVAITPEVQAVWRDLHEGLPEGMTRDARVDIGLSTDALVEWSSSRSSLVVSTGAHDERMVPAHELGSGLQSLLLLRLLQAEGGDAPGALVLLEEPEAFLHPSAQRALARTLFDAPRLKLVATTHSTVVIDEAVAADVILVRDHRVFSPADVDERRRQINSALLTGQGSEAIFSRSVLLVEGPGDRAFFERVRRRLGLHLPVSVLSNLGIVAVGGKARFGPWIQLLESYVDRHSGFQPIDYLVVADSADAGSDVATAFRNAGQTVPAEVGRLIMNLSAAAANWALGDVVAATVALNAHAHVLGFAIAMLPVDLEYAALCNVSVPTLARISSTIGVEASTAEELMSRLGSKYNGTVVNRAKKDDWMRAEIAEAVPLEELSDAVRSVLRRWLAPVLRESGNTLPDVLK